MIEVFYLFMYVFIGFSLSILFLFVDNKIGNIRGYKYQIFDQMGPGTAVAFTFLWPIFLPLAILLTCFELIHYYFLR